MLKINKSAESASTVVYCAVVECYICCRRLVVKLFGGIISIYIGVSNRYNV